MNDGWSKGCSLVSSGAMLVALIASALAGASADVRADLADTVAVVKKSVVAVGTFEPTRSPQFRFLGTGFVAGNGNQVVTNAHVEGAVVENQESKEQLVVALPGTGRVVARPVRREAIDRDHDVSVLRFDGPPMPALRLGNSDTVRDGQDIALTGFPLGSAIGIVPVTHKGIISAITPVGQPLPSARQLEAQAVRRLATGSYSVFQLDAVSYPGNSGSPVYNPATGEVLGIVNMVFVKGSKEAAITNPSAISYAIPASFIKVLLQQP
ncbi:serine protease [Zoogloea sp. LCSB751]|uniref:S1 family peptidase n=1 Tax=Zoogloea sp. LCSB751 TaxID=1965277 RepID=UPI0009A4DD89|nr:serine protease [Zoogloea sp. LCSB751]